MKRGGESSPWESCQNKIAQKNYLVDLKNNLLKIALREICQCIIYEMWHLRLDYLANYDETYLHVPKGW